MLAVGRLVCKRVVVVVVGRKVFGRNAVLLVVCKLVVAVCTLVAVGKLVVLRIRVRRKWVVGRNFSGRIELDEA